MRPQSACAAASVLALLAACGDDPEPPIVVPPEPVAPPAAPLAGPPLAYACESGQSVTVAYPDGATAQVTYKGRAYAMRIARSGSGARYTGSGLEWWTATRQGIEGATLSQLRPGEDVAETVLERCRRPGAGSVLPPTPADGAAPPCRGPQLALSNDGGDAGAGHRRMIVGVRNVGAQACSLIGYPGVVLQDRGGRDLSSVRVDQALGGYLSPGQTPAPVALAPQARAYFDLAWTVVPNEGQGEKTCPSAARIRMTAPDDTSPVALAQAFTPCGGRAEVTPFRAEAEPKAAAAT
jgi:membrane-bound inhibitor of C-type lysozyme